MPLQLILQFRGDALRHLDAIEDFTSRLSGVLGDAASLDGEDRGAHGANIFLFTDDPQTAFDRAEAFIGAKAMGGYAVACRPISSEKFRMLWPPDATAEFRLR